eukprot:1143280-Pelagomonas_calceolata.AAC.1
MHVEMELRRVLDKSLIELHVAAFACSHTFIHNFTQYTAIIHALHVLWSMVMEGVSQKFAPQNIHRQ